jgi:dienelactone hydrolase
MLERFARLPSALQANARWRRLGSSRIPAMLVHPNGETGPPVPVVIWMHGRTGRKELDPGRYLRLMRSGIGLCAVDLPAHGERFDAALQEPSRTLDVIAQMIDEIDQLVDGLLDTGLFDRHRLGIGGMSAGGMATMARLCREHPFRCASVEAATGSWAHQRRREMFRGRSDDLIERLNPIANIARWREIPFQAIHARLDSWVSFEGQAAFIEELQWHYADPELVEFVTYERTGAPFEHAGFGKMAADAKERQRAFFARWLLDAKKPQRHA